MTNTLLNEHSSDDTHIRFEEMTAYVFSDGKQASFLKTAAVINKHVTDCSQCFKMYQGLMLLRDRLEQYTAIETASEQKLIRLLRFFLPEAKNRTPEQVVDECMRFKVWLSFGIKNMKELLQLSAPGFSNPRLVTVMKSSDGSNGIEETESVIRSSLFDKDKNRVSIGLDGSLSLYFDSSTYAEGRRVLLLPDDCDEEPTMIELIRYDDSISYVRFEGIIPGKYTVMIERS